MLSHVPEFSHDCESCRYAATLLGDTLHDVYLCDESIVIRYGDQPCQYRSLQREYVRLVAREKPNGIYARALRVIARAQSLGTLGNIPKS